MPLEFIDLRRGDANKYEWEPFESSVGYENARWWQVDHPSFRDSWYVQVLDDGTEVARIELDETVGIEHYAGVPPIGDERLEIQFFEVAIAVRGRGIGTRVIRGLADRHPHRRLLAYSEDADGFWSSLGWDRFDHPDTRGPRYRALFIQPAH